MKTIGIFLLLLILTTSSFATFTNEDDDNGNRSCWLNNIYLYVTKMPKGWLVTTFNGGVVYIHTEPNERLGLCGV